MIPRRKFIDAATIVLTVCVGFGWLGFQIVRALPMRRDASLPMEFGALEGGKVGTYRSRVADIPPSVVKAANRVLGSDKFEMADVHGKWNVTDFMVDPSLPSRRLCWGVSVDECFILHYEMGGLGHSWHVLVFGPERNGRRECIWAGSLDHSYCSVYTLSRGLARGQFVSFPALMH